MSSDINVQTFSGKVNINNNLLVGSSHLFVDTVNNRVGITTADPDAGLHVNSNAYVHTDFRVGTSIVMNDTTGQITAGSFVGDGSGLDGINSDSGSWVNGTGKVYLSTTTDKVGIGITGPLGKLYIAADYDHTLQRPSNSSNHYLVLSKTGAQVVNEGPGISFCGSYNSSNDYQDVMAEIRGVCDTDGGRRGRLEFWTSSSDGINVVDTQAMTIKSDGNVGIGTTSPDNKFEVFGSSWFAVDVSSADHVIVGNKYSSSDSLSLVSLGSVNVCCDANDNTSGKVIDFRTNSYSNGGTLLMRIKDNGDVGIGTADTGTHGAKLIVNGTMGTYMSGSTVANRFYVYNQSFASPVVNQIHLSLRNYNDTAPSQTQADRKSGFWFGQYNDQNYTNGEQFIGFTHAIRFIKCDPDDYASSIVYDSNTFNAKINGNLQSRLGSIDSSSTSNPINFTGQHRCVVENFDTNLEGLIVSANKSEYCSMSNGLKRGLQAVTVNEALPIVTLSRTCMDKSCFGVISLSEDPENETREDRFGCFVAEFEKEEGDERVYINSVGEGAIWVTNINGPLESGDYITTSTIPGYGQRQNDDILHNYTVAKITMNCDFEPVLQNVKKIKKILVKKKLWYKNENTEIDYQEYLTISDEKKYTFVEDGKTKYMKTIKRYSKEKIAEYDLEEVSEIMKNVLDEHGQIQWEDTEETEKAYKIRYLLPDGTQISEEEYTTRALADERVFIAAFVGCTYHCG